jgi:hypothetical protein
MQQLHFNVAMEFLTELISRAEEEITQKLQVSMEEVGTFRHEEASFAGVFFQFSVHGKSLIGLVEVEVALHRVATSN